MRRIFKIALVVILIWQITDLFFLRPVRVYPDLSNTSEIAQNQVFIFKYEGFWAGNLTSCIYSPGLFTPGGERIQAVTTGFPTGKAIEPEDSLTPGYKVLVKVRAECGISLPEIGPIILFQINILKKEYLVTEHKLSDQAILDKMIQYGASSSRDEEILKMMLKSAQEMEDK